MGSEHVWEEVGAIGQLLGSLAVLVTLIYLSIQVRHARSEAQRSISESRAQRSLEINLALATNERLAAIHAKANATLMSGGDKSPSPFMEEWTRRTGLTREEAISLHSESIARWSNVAQTFLYIDELNPGDRAQFDGSTRFALSEHAYRLWYDLFKPNLNPDAVRYVDNLLARPD